MLGPKPGNVGSSRKGLEGPICSIRQRADAKVQALCTPCEQAYSTALVGTNTRPHTHLDTNTRREAAATQKVSQWDVRWDEESRGLGQGLGKQDLHHWAAGIETILL